MPFHPVDSKQSFPRLEQDVQGWWDLHGIIQKTLASGDPTRPFVFFECPVVVVDESKLVERLGRGRVPVEVVPFLWRDTSSRLRALGAKCQLRRRGPLP